MEIGNGLVWSLKCRECKANIGAKGMESVIEAEKWIQKHAEETGHTNFDMDVLGFSIIIESITAG